MKTKSTNNNNNLETLTLITTETFDDLPYNFYRNNNNEYLLTREQIGEALEYSNPSKAIQMIHLKHKDRLEPLCIRIKSNTCTDQSQTEGSRDLNKTNVENLITERVYYTQRGIMEICRWSRQPKANNFMDWTWDIIEAYRNNELNNLSFSSSNSQNISTEITNQIIDMTQSISLLTVAIKEMQDEICNIKHTTNSKNDGKYSQWMISMFPKYQILAEHFGISYKQLYRELFLEFQNRHPEINLNKLVNNYCIENKTIKCYTLDAIEHNEMVRTLFQQMVDELIDIYHLSDKPLTNEKYTTIFSK